MSLTEMPAVLLRITDPSAQPVRCRSMILVGAAVVDLDRIKREYEAQGMVAEVEADMQLGGRPDMARHHWDKTGDHQKTCGDCGAVATQRRPVAASGIIACGWVTEYRQPGGEPFIADRVPPYGSVQPTASAAGSSTRCACTCWTGSASCGRCSTSRTSAPPACSPARLSGRPSCSPQPPSRWPAKPPGAPTRQPTPATAPQAGARR